MKLVFVSRFIAFDHVNKNYYVVSINDSTTWGDDTLKLLKNVDKINLDSIPNSVKNLAKDEDLNLIRFEFPSQDTYKQQFDKCQEYLHSGIPMSCVLLPN